MMQHPNKTRLTGSRRGLRGLTGEIVEGCRDVFGGVAVRRVADHQAGFAHSSIPEQHTLQQSLLGAGRPAALRFMRRNRRSH